MTTTTLQQTDAQKVFKTPFSAAYWRCALGELKNLRMILLAAIFIAIRVALKSISIPVPGAQSLYITFGYLFNALGSMIYGPIVGFLSGGVCDIIGCITAPKGPYFFPFTLVEMLGSLLYGLFLYRSRITMARIFVSKLTVTVLINLICTPFLMSVMYGKGYLFYLASRVGKNAILLPIETILLIALFSAVLPIIKRLKIAPVPDPIVRPF